MRLRHFLIAASFITVSLTILGLGVAGLIFPRLGNQIKLPSDVIEAPREVFDIPTDPGTRNPGTEAPAAQGMLHPGGRDILESTCSQCHVAQSLEEIRKSRTEWEKTLEQMEAMGVKLDDTEKVILLDYLAVAENP